MDFGKVSVRKIVEFVLRRGSIERGTNSQHTALAGAQIHRQLQKAAGPDYQKEVFLKQRIELGADHLTIEGRADGVFQEGGWVIDEIKTSATPFLELAPTQKEQFFHQGMVYAYLYAYEHQLTEIAVQLTYFQTVEETITRERKTFTFEELSNFFNELVNGYHRWLLLQKEWVHQRNQGLNQLIFPYPEYRKGQRELAVAVYKTFKTQQQLFVEAPTGTGKTISTLFPALKALGEGEVTRLFYLTAKTITRQVAEDSLVELAKHGGVVKAVTLTARDKICVPEKGKCSPENCPYALGYYNRLNDGLWDILTHETLMTREVIVAYAQKHQLCPFEFSLDVSLWCDVIIGDYNYVFDPTVYLRRFFEENNEEYYFLVDEAHNLVNRAREMYSATLTRSGGRALKEKLSKDFKKLQRKLTRVDRELADLEQLSRDEGWEFKHQQAQGETLLKHLYALSEELKLFLAEEPQNSAHEVAMAYYLEVLRFLRMNELYDEHYETTITRSYQDLTIKAFCIDPAAFLQATFAKAKSSIVFSASFSPLAYYQAVLGAKEDALRYKLASPFDARHQRLVTTSYIQTTYKKRQASLADLVEAIAATTQTKTGNYLVFFPSYQYLDEVVARFQERYPQVATFIQATQMDEREREAFLAHFVVDPPRTFIGFCVLGGIFSEGIDLKGTRLIGSLIVGVGLPQINHEQELIRTYFDQAGKNGFDFAYRLPGMNKVLQAAGRVIRDVTDTGVVVLLDQRFTTAQYRQLFPPHWQNGHVISSSQQLAQTLTDFWQTSD
ncbi:MAG: ATP-dependent DNA helicase [Enterococcus sp.]